VVNEEDLRAFLEGGPPSQPTEEELRAHLAGPQEEPPEDKKRIAPGVRLLQGLLGMSRLVVGSGEEPRRRVGPGGPEAGERPAWARVPGEKVAELYGALEERQPRPEFEALEIGSVGELATSLGRNIPALAAEGVEMIPGLVAAEASLVKAFPSLAAKAPAAKGFMDIRGGLARAGQRAKHGAGLGEAYALLSGEAVEHPEALVIDPLLFAGLEPVAGAFGDVVMSGTRAARGVGRTEGVPSTLRSLLSPREVPADAAVGRDIAEALAIRSAEPGSGVAGQAARPALAPELTEKGNLRHVLRGTDRADLGEAGAQLGRALEDEAHAANLAVELEQLARQQRVGSVVAPEFQPEIPGFVPRPGEGVAGAAARPSLVPELTEKGTLSQILKGGERAELRGAGEDLSAKLAEEAQQAGLTSDLARFTEVAEREAAAAERLATEAPVDLLAEPPKVPAAEVFKTSEEALGKLADVDGRIGNLSIDELSPQETLSGLNVGQASPELTTLLAERDEVLRQIYRAGKGGYISNRALMALGRGSAGAVIGGTTGRTPEERATNAALMGLGFVAGPGMLRRIMTRPESLSDLPAHSQAIQERIGTGGRPRESLGEMVKNAYFNIVSRSAPFRWLEKDIGRPLTTTESVDAAARSAQGSNRRASAFMEYGPARLGEAGEWIPTGTPGISQITDLVEGDVAGLTRYQLAQRTLELAPRGVKTGITPADALAEVRGASPQMEQAHRAMVEFDQAILDYAAEAGLFGPGEVEAMKMLGEHYIHLGRAFDVGGLPSGRTKAGIFKRLTPEGSTRLILDPFISRLDRTLRIVAAADRQRVGLRLLNLVEKFPERMKGVAELDTTQRAARKASHFGERLRAAALEEGVDIPAGVAEGLAERLGSKALTVADGTILVNRGGVPIRLKVEPQLFAAMQAVGPRDVGGLVRLASGLSSTFKGGVTLDPGFVIDNAWRDSFDAALQSTYGFRPFLDSAKGLVESINARWLKNPSDLYKQAARAGLGFSTHRGAGRRAAEALGRELVKPRTRGESILRTVKHPIEALQRFTQPFEEAARFAEFVRAKGAGADDIRAFMAQQDVTVNFQESGAHAAMQAMNAMTPFMNPGIQSLDRAFKAAKDHPKRLVAMGLASITVPSVLLWAASRGDEEVTQYRKSRSGLLNWFIRVPSSVPGVGGEVLKLKKPFLYGQVFGTGVEAILDAVAEKDPGAMDRWAEGVRDQSGVNMVPQALQIPLAMSRNKVPLFDTPIESQQTRDMPPTHRRTPFTGSTALAIGEETGKIPGVGQFLSPGRIEFLVGQITGTLGSRLLDVSDFVIDEVRAGQPGAASKPARELAEIPGMSRFVQRQATTSVEPVQAFYEEFHRLGELTRGFRDDLKNNPRRATETLTERSEDLALFKIYDSVNGNMSAMRQAIIRLEKVPDTILSREDKLERKKQYTAAIIAYAEQAREAADKFRDKGK